MKNLNEPHRDVPAETLSTDPQVVPIGTLRSKNPCDPPLIPKRETEDLRLRWTAVQSTFVDNPRKAVDDANALVSSAMKQIEESFRSQRTQIEKQLTKGVAASTEDLRVALQNYRTLFDRLLTF
jgi:hypothetical protein